MFELNSVQWLYILLCFELFHLVPCQVLWHSYEDLVGAENYSYFRITQPGKHRLEVVSVTGDADLYVSQTISDKIPHPSYVDYDLKSATCGIDTIDIPRSFNRPVEVSVYGHPNYHNTTFIFNIYYLSNDETDEYEEFVKKYHTYENINTNSEIPQSEKHYNSNKRKVQDDDDDDSESPWMTLLIGILKIILDILF